MPPDHVITIVQSSSASWTVWLPFAASSLLFMGAMITLYITNRTNRAGIAAANVREHEKWRKDVAQKAIIHILTLSDDARQRIQKRLKVEEVSGIYDELIELVAGTRSAANSLRVVSDSLSKKSAELSNALDAALVAAVDLQLGILSGAMTSEELREAQKDAADSLAALNAAEKSLIEAARSDFAIAP